MREWFSSQAFWTLLALLWLGQTAVGQASSQTLGGVLQGTVIDPAGAVISGALVTATEESTSRVYHAKTDDSGQYRLSALIPGKYTVRCEMRQFKTETKTSVAVDAGQVAPLNFQLAVGAYEDVRGPRPAMTVIIEPIGPPVQIELYPTGALAGAITGYVGDPSGAAIHGAQVTVTQESSSNVYRVKTDDSGAYRVSPLSAGKYTLRFEMKGFATVTKPSVVVHPSQPTRLDVRLAVGSYSGPEITPADRVEVCTASCPIQIFTPSPPHQGIALQIYAESNIIDAGGSLWLNVLLSNTTNRPIFVHSQPGLARAFGYQIYALGPCGCPGRVYQRDVASSESNLRIPPGGSLTDRIDLSKLMDLSQPATYTILAQGPDTSNAVNYYEGIKDAPLITSNSITVRVLAPY